MARKKHPKADPRVAFVARVEAIAGSVYDRIQAQLDDTGERLRGAAIEAIERALTNAEGSLLVAAHVERTTPVPRKKKPLELPPAPDDVAGRAMTSTGKALPTCKKCGRYGANSRGCGTSHEPLNTAPEAEPADDGDEDSEPRPSRSSRDPAKSRISSSARAAMARTREARAAG